MAYGLEVYNASGYLQIDQFYPQYSVIQEGIASSNTTVNFPFQSSTPLIVVRPVSTVDEIGRLHVITNSSFKAMMLSGGSYGGSFYYKVLVPINTLPAPPAGSYGLVLYDSSGTIVFNSTLTNVFRVQQAVSFVPGGFHSSISVSNGGGQIWWPLNQLRWQSTTAVGEGDMYDIYYDVVTVRRDSESQISHRVAGVWNEFMFTASPPHEQMPGGVPVTLLIGTFVG